jgi:2-polyprenyl-3-methyl-5-hydroxy-6-metoxy-1,4-benzoquinol methylase
VANCCSPKGYRWVFSERSAQSEARRYRRKGLDPVSRRIVDFLIGEGIEGKSVLEIGGGIGAIQLELLKAGAARATSVELTPTYEHVATELINESGLGGRVQRRLMDFAATPAEAEPADVVIMNRVVCCYPDMPRLTRAAADHTHQLLVLTYPRRTWWTRIGLRFGNLLLRLARREFQIFLHPPKEILATSEQRGVETVLNQEGLLWTMAALRRRMPQSDVG